MQPRPADRRDPVYAVGMPKIAHAFLKSVSLKAVRGSHYGEPRTYQRPVPPPEVKKPVAKKPVIKKAPVKGARTAYERILDDE